HAVWNVIDLIDRGLGHTSHLNVLTCQTLKALQPSENLTSGPRGGLFPGHLADDRLRPRSAACHDVLLIFIRAISISKCVQQPRSLWPESWIRRIPRNRRRGWLFAKVRLLLIEPRRAGQGVRVEAAALEGAGAEFLDVAHGGTQPQPAKAVPLGVADEAGAQSGSRQGTSQRHGSDDLARQEQIGATFTGTGPNLGDPVAIARQGRLHA